MKGYRNLFLKKKIVVHVIKDVDFRRSHAHTVQTCTTLRASESSKYTDTFSFIENVYNISVFHTHVRVHTIHMSTQKCTYPFNITGYIATG